jgi:MFS transporter, putative metabolite:H+ symporter
MESKESVKAIVIVAALGYFVDVYDLVLFSVVRTQSLKDLGYFEDTNFTYGILLLNVQMIGMLIGGFVWGILGDKRGRLTVLFGSILMYSLANILNAFVTDISSYCVLRFIAGFGLAGELGAGITLVAEVLPTSRRGIGTTIVATVGVMGAVVAASLGQFFSWRTSYLVGGVLGLFLLLLRVSVSESNIFTQLKDRRGSRGQLSLLFRKRERFMRLVYCSLIGVPCWFVIGVLITFIPEIAISVGVKSEISVGRVVQIAYIGLVIGDLVSGFLSQYLASRRKVLFLFLLLCFLTSSIFIFNIHLGPDFIYFWSLPLGFSVGYWAVFVTTSAELFGTNLRATVSTAVPNLVRGSTALLSALFGVASTYFSPMYSAFLIGLGCISLALIGCSKISETFSTDLNFEEL